MRASGGTQTFKNLTGGLNVLDAIYDIADNEARDLRNYVPTTRGALRKRDGSQVWATMGAVCQSLYASPSPNFLIAGQATTLQSVSPAKAVVQLATGLTNAKWQFVNAPSNGGQGPIYGMNGVEARYTNGTLAGTGAWTAATGTLPIGKYLLYHGNRVFVAGMSAYGAVVDPGSTLVFSNLANPRDWPVANVVQFDPNDGEAITGICTLGPYVVVFKPSKTWLVYDLNAGANRRIGIGFGTVAARSAVETPLGVFMLSKDQGVMLVTESSVKRVSDKILPLIQSLGSVANAVGAWINQRYYLAVSSLGGANDLLLDYDTKTNSWWVHSLGSADIVAWTPSNTPLLFDANAAAATTRQLFVPGLTQDDVPSGGGAGTNWTSYWRGPYYPFGRPEIRKRIREVRIDGRGRVRFYASIDFQVGETLFKDITFATDSGTYGVDDGSTFGVDDGSVFGGQAVSQQAIVPTLGVGRAWSPVFINDTSDTLEIDSYTFAIGKRTD
jgi:hypothetical protein